LDEWLAKRQQIASTPVAPAATPPNPAFGPTTPVPTPVAPPMPTSIPAPQAAPTTQTVPAQEVHAPIRSQSPAPTAEAPKEKVPEVIPEPDKLHIRDSDKNASDGISIQLR